MPDACQHRRDSVVHLCVIGFGGQNLSKAANGAAPATLFDRCFGVAEKLRSIKAARMVIDSRASMFSVHTPIFTMNASSGAITSCSTAGLPASVPKTMGTPARAALTSPS